ncbi:DUF5133 domain-containing protein [Streptomyces syringium]|uniref:DUF5133 domain-containing protein n=1 Tax=Streptomyces syringium TaxID=76729 RepID=A0ABS4YBU2_9ACTN|nr:DUF5133 domain-containing protein [Streptomyces syringium]MBP2406271.1 hypothetical protein [Streptomyces syringium]SPE63833.1 hypothetical protein SNS2_5157 [Streptomyces netropsis]
MLMAHPAVLRDLLDRYESLRAVAGERVVRAQIYRRLQDTAYTLCVTTGTRDIDAALRAARSRVAQYPAAEAVAV